MLPVVVTPSRLEPFLNLIHVEILINAMLKNLKKQSLCGPRGGGGGGGQRGRGRDELHPLHPLAEVEGAAGPDPVGVPSHQVSTPDVIT